MSWMRSLTYLSQFLRVFLPTLTCLSGVRQGACLSPFLLSTYVNDLEETFVLQDFKSIEFDMLIFLSWYVDDIAIFSFESEAGL